MAGDWIKMRVNLVSHPKVLAIAQFLADDAEYQSWSTMGGFVPGFGGNAEDDEREYQASLRVTRYVTVCALLRFWGYANEHAKGEFIGSLRLRDIDDVVQVPGFGAALQSIGWAEYDADKRGLALPNFNEYNTSGSERSAGAKSSAQRQKEYRDRKKAAESDVTRDAQSDVTSNRREEKSREEKDISVAKGDLPTCNPKSVIDLYHEVLPELPAVRLTTEARKKSIAKLWRWVLTSTKTDGSRRAYDADQAMTWLRDYFTRARDNDFLMGRTGRTGEHANWQCDLDFLLTEKGMKHVIEKTKETA